LTLSLLNFGSLTSTYFLPLYDNTNLSWFFLLGI
jgi:hypothetical protein